MGYATLADVERLEAHRTFTPNSHPSKDDVIEFIETSSLELDAAMYSLGYGLPVSASSSPRGHALLVRWNALGADAQVQAAAAESKRRKDALQAWQSAIKALRDGKYELPDVPREATTELKLRVGTGTGDEASAFFFRDMQL